MEISSNGVTSATLEDYLKKWTTYLKTKYGNDFVIKSEGVIDNLAVGVSASNLDFESNLLYLTKNMNPYTAEDEFQDALYSLIGLIRQQATFTVVQRTVQGTPNTTIESGQITFKNATTEDQFVLNDDCQLNANGIGTGSFQAIEFGAIELDNDAECSLVSAPSTVTGVYYSAGNEISVGLDYEDDATFRNRWLENQSTVQSSTEGGLQKALLPYCDNKAKNIKIRMNRNTQKYSDVDLNSENIVVNSAYDDETIAKIILNNIVDGVGLNGSITQTVIDSEGNEETILFSRATSVPIYYNVKLVLDDDIELEQVKSTVQDTIKNNFNLAMGEPVVANKMISLVDALSGIDYVDEIKVSKDNSTWQSVVTLTEIELGKIEGVNVTV